MEHLEETPRILKKLFEKGTLIICMSFFVAAWGTAAYQG